MKCFNYIRRVKFDEKQIRIVTYPKYTWSVCPKYLNFNIFNHMIPLQQRKSILIPQYVVRWMNNKQNEKNETSENSKIHYTSFEVYIKTITLQRFTFDYKSIFKFYQPNMFDPLKASMQKTSYFNFNKNIIEQPKLLNK